MNLIKSTDYCHDCEQIINFGCNFCGKPELLKRRKCVKNQFNQIIMMCKECQQKHHPVECCRELCKKKFNIQKSDDYFTLMATRKRYIC